MAERTLLLNLTNKYKSILENKTTNAVIWKAKADVWKKIQNAFISSNCGPVRIILIRNSVLHFKNFRHVL